MDVGALEQGVIAAISAMLIVGIVAVAGEQYQSPSRETGDPLEEELDSIIAGYSLDTVALPEEGCDERGTVYTRFERNHSGWEYDPRPYRVTTNSEGWREPREFNRTPPEGVSRILVLGDSFTFGTGVNASDTYVERFERLIDNSTDQQYQVINAGAQGAGMLDYCSMLEHRGLRYDPDLVIVTFTYYDAISRRRADTIYRQVRELDDPAITDESWLSYAGDLKTELYRRMEFNATAALPVYMERIDRMASDQDVPVVFYSFRPIDDHMARSNRHISAVGFLEEYMRENNLTLIRAPPIFEERPVEEYTLSDGHYDEWGHRMLADRLDEQLRERHLVPRPD